MWKRVSFGGCFSFAFFGCVGEPRVFCVRLGLEFRWVGLGG